MNILKKMNVKSISLILCYMTIYSYIILGNCLTYNLGNRLPLKVAEVIGMISALILIIIHRLKILKVDKKNFKVFIWFAIAAIPIFINGYQIKEMVYGMLYPIRILFTFAIVIIITNTLKKYEVSMDKILNTILNGYLVVCLIGIWQIIFYPNAFKFYDLFYKIGVYYPNPDPHEGRIVSTYFDPNFLAACLITPMIIAYHYFFKTNKGIYLFEFLLILFVITFTVSRSGLVGAISAIAVYAMLRFWYKNREADIKKKNKICIIITGIICIVFVILVLFSDIRVFKRIRGTAEDGSTYARIETWNNGIGIIQGENKQQENKQPLENKMDMKEKRRDKINKIKHTLFGIGYNMVGFTETNKEKGSSTAFGNDSSLLLVAITSGLIGGIYFACLMILNIINGYLRRNENDMHMILLPVIIVALMICNFNNLLFYILWIFPTVLLYNMFKDRKLELGEINGISSTKRKNDKEGKASIILLNYNNVKDTKECINSIRRNEKNLNYDIIVVDNKSTDDSISELERIENIILIKNKENDGFAAGNNSGIEYAIKNGTEYILLLNNDTEIEKNAISIMLENYKKHKEVGIMGARIMYSDNRKIINYCGGHINLKRATAIHENYKEKYVDKGVDCKETGFITGCAMLFSKEIIEKVGYLPEEYFMYYEDVDFCIKVREKGFKLMVSLDSVIYHKVSSSSGGEQSPFSIKWGTRNRILFMNKFKDYISGIDTYAFFYLTRIMKIFIYTLKGKKEEKEALIEGIKEAKKLNQK